MKSMKQRKHISFMAISTQNLEPCCICRVSFSLKLCEKLLLFNDNFDLNFGVLYCRKNILMEIILGVWNVDMISTQVALSSGFHRKIYALFARWLAFLLDIYLNFYAFVERQKDMIFFYVHLSFSIPRFFCLSKSGVCKRKEEEEGGNNGICYKQIWLSIWKWSG